MLVTVHLHNVIFFAHHGIYKEEKEKGNHFELNLDVLYRKSGYRFDSIEHTVNYEELYSIMQTEMLIPTPLLEHIGYAIIHKIKKRLASVKEIRITIYKLEPPLPGFKGRAGVTLVKKFK